MIISYFSSNFSSVYIFHYINFWFLEPGVLNAENKQKKSLVFKITLIFLVYIKSGVRT